MHLNDPDISQIAHRLRCCIEGLDPAYFTPTLDNFPRGACGSSSRLLGAFLADFGHDGFECVCGERGDHADRSWTSHAWLRRGSLVADITADQFLDAPSAVIVAHNSKWHMSFELKDEPTPADFRLEPGPGNFPLYSLYAALEGPMSKSN